MKVKVWTILFLFSITFYSFKLSIAFFHYAFFNENFTELYCVNKDKPEMNCNGKCHLEKETKNDSSAGYLTPDLHQLINLYCVEFIDFKCDLTSFYIEEEANFIYENLYKNIFLERDFNPPEYLS